VSNVVHGKSAVSAQLRARVEAAIDELGYIPNLHARRLRAGLTGRLTLEVPDGDDPLRPRLYEHLVNACSRRGYLLEIRVTAPLGHRSAVAADGVLRYRSPADAEPPTVPTVLLDGAPLAGCDWVGPASSADGDIHELAEIAVAFLLTRIEGFDGPQRHHVIRRERF
jgi:DNA-binding LacI/PurR family transcriptional regulator